MTAIMRPHWVKATDVGWAVSEMVLALRPLQLSQTHRDSSVTFSKEGNNMSAYNVTITPHLYDGRQITPAFQFAIEAHAPHTAVHRALMRLCQDRPFTKHCSRFEISVKDA